ncbi:MAG TPA: effector binding domain-containing protein [Symbiobacteriaceae bacterium]|nr:effector binding domain-containing protein [Symbiobacteriaceae bacterium]
MNALEKIGDVADRYSVTGRTLRYYEEIGLLSSVRPPFTQQRYYDPAAVARLEQVLLLRKLDLPIKDIQAIFASKDLRVALDAFVRKLQALDDEMGRLEQLRGVIEGFLALLQDHGYDTGAGLRLLQENAAELAEPRPPVVKEVPSMSVTLDHVRIIQLKPMRVATYQVESPTPEEDSWRTMLKWAGERGLVDLPTTRFFGFNNPDPAPDRQGYGYEVWVTLPDGVEATDPLRAHNFPGGLYAVTSTYLYEIRERWEALWNWVNKSPDYAWAPTGRWLEETTGPEKTATPTNQLQLDLYMPITKK